MRYAGHVDGMYETKNGCCILFKDPKENLPVWESKGKSVDGRKELVTEFTDNVF